MNSLRLPSSASSSAVLQCLRAPQPPAVNPNRVDTERLYLIEHVRVGPISKTSVQIASFPI